MGVKLSWQDSYISKSVSICIRRRNRVGLKTSHRCLAVENRCDFSARRKAFCDSSVLVLVVQSADCSRLSVHWRRNKTTRHINPVSYVRLTYSFWCISRSVLCMSVRPSQSWVTPKRFTVSKYSLYHTIELMMSLVSWGHISQSWMYSRSPRTIASKTGTFLS